MVGLGKVMRWWKWRGERRGIGWLGRAFCLCDVECSFRKTGNFEVEKRRIRFGLI
jgi:hypothetical protein